MACANYPSVNPVSQHVFFYFGLCLAVALQVAHSDTHSPAPFFHPPSHHPSPSVSSRFHFILVQRISVKQAQPSPPASISTILCFPGVLFWVPFLGTLDPHPLTPCYILLMQTFRNLCKINKKINPGASLTVLYPPHFLIFPTVSSTLLPFSHSLFS